MNRSHLLSAAMGSVCTLAIMTAFGLAPTQPADTTSDSQLLADTEPLSKQSLALALAYEREWHSFFYDGLGTAGDPDTKAIGLSKQVTSYLAVSSTIESDAHLSNALQDIPMSQQDHDRLTQRLDFLRRERGDILYQLITGPFKTRLPHDTIAKSFSPNKL